jgi:ABC-type dipeptide/oligopeptide/nickel transport system permease component
MLRFVARRVILLALSAWLVASAAFVLGQLAQGDEATQSLGFAGNPATLARIRQLRGLDRPLSERYVAWNARLARLDFGTSIRFGRPVGPLVADRAANTTLLAVSAFLLAAVLGLAGGMVTGSRPGSVPAAVVRGLSIVLLSCPPLLASILLVWAAVVTGALPAGGIESAEAGASFLARLADVAHHLPLPALALGLPLAAVIERVAAQAIREALAEPSIVAARARGVPERDIRWRHALRLAAAPILAVAGTVAGAMLSGSVAVELVTSWPGLGGLTFAALTARDADLAAGCAIAAALGLGLAILAGDVALAAVDPRVRLDAPRREELVA